MEHEMGHEMGHQMAPNKMDHENMNHEIMNHENMDHGNMDHGNMDHGNMDHGGLSHDDMMKMYFYFGYENVQMLLKNWKINTPIELLWTCCILFFVTLFHEWLRVWRDNQATRTCLFVHIFFFDRNFDFLPNC